MVNEARVRQGIYLDFNATTPTDARVVEAMLPYLGVHFGNPSSPHRWGVTAREAVEQARAQVAALIACRPAEIVFTSGGSESNNLAIRGVAASSGEARGHIVTSAIEHPAVLEPCRRLQAEGFGVTVVGVDGLGKVDPGDVARALSRDTLLVSIMHANNEVGTIEPLQEISRLAHERNVPVHVDAAQSVGKIRVDVGTLGADFLSIAGHKLYAPKGVGALYVRAGRRLPPLILGAGHEGGLRAGTENVAGIVGLGKACEIAAANLAADARHCRKMRDRLWHGLSRLIEDVRRHGDAEDVLPNTLSVGLPGVDAGRLLVEIGDRVAASAGAACHSGKVTSSPVLAAMHVPPEIAAGTVRFSVGRSTTPEEIDAAVEIVASAAGRSGSRPGEGVRRP
jgi:cysteine desulfurase